MSHFTVLITQITDIDTLVKALAEVGFEQVEVHETAQPLYGYQGDVRPETAEVIIRREFIGEASNDIGFKRRPDGNFEAIISEYDRFQYSEQWLNLLAQRYAYHATRAQLAKQGFNLIAEETQQDGQIHLTLQRMA